MSEVPLILSLVVILMALVSCGLLTQEPKNAFGRGGMAYLGASTIVYDNDLFEVKVSLRNPDAENSIAFYTDCVAANFTLQAGHSFARRVKTETGWRNRTQNAKSLYTVSRSRPEGPVVLEASRILPYCTTNKIPLM